MRFVHENREFVPCLERIKEIFQPLCAARCALHMLASALILSFEVQSALYDEEHIRGRFRLLASSMQLLFESILQIRRGEGVCRQDGREVFDRRRRATISDAGELDAIQLDTR